MKRTPRPHGGFLIGLVVGLLIGLAAALAVALYVTKVPVPFVNKVPQRTAEQDAAEAEKNRNWDPNAPLAGKTAMKPASAPAAASAPAGTAAASAPAASAKASAPERGASKPARDPAALLAGAPVPDAASAPGKAARPGAEPFLYFVQAGAFQVGDDAEQQRAKLAMQGFTAKVTEREQAGRTMYRVRLGPFETREEAEGMQQRLQGAGHEAALVRVNR